jgi:hypothetical protein
MQFFRHILFIFYCSVKKFFYQRLGMFHFNALCVVIGGILLYFFNSVVLRNPSDKCIISSDATVREISRAVRYGTVRYGTVRYGNSRTSRTVHSRTKNFPNDPVPSIPEQNFPWQH